ncbi:MAG: dethiobiotin synthase [Chromatiales bacterium]|nr:dethiobiotin synthase [Gammaproteobacteria bacterium]MBW6476373.1 dethiobiotin synthase [Chromatiales bacterium]
MQKGYFITGTDTGVGKTWATLALMAHLQQAGHCVLGMKPVASGCEQTAEGLRNEDALLIQQQSTIALPYDAINPYAFAPAIAPHLAATQAGVEIDLSHLTGSARALQQQSDYLIVEGAGGWLVPLNKASSIADLAWQLQLPVILVVSLRLGCINHALLSATAIRQSGCELAGWVANILDPQMPCLQQNIDSITARVPAPLLGTLPYQQQRNTMQLAQHLSV